MPEFVWGFCIGSLIGGVVMHLRYSRALRKASAKVQLITDMIRKEVMALGDNPKRDS